MSLSLADYALWLLSAIAQLLLICFMMKRGLRDRFPFFFTYSAFQIVSSLSLFAVFRIFPAQYFNVYWAFGAASILLGFAVIYEVFAYSVKPYPGLRDLGAMAFRWVLVLLVMVTGIIAISGGGSSADRVVREIVNLERSVRLMQCGLLLFVALSSNYLGTSWRNFASGIALGFGIFAATDLVLFNLRASQGAELNRILSLITTAAYNLSVLTWLGYSLLPQVARKRTEGAYKPTLDRWNQAAMAAVHARQGGVRDFTYISDVEQMVENVLARNVSNQ